jgi:hypothetical protein
VPAYLVIHPREHRRDDVLIQADDLTLDFRNGWAVISDNRGPCYAIPNGQGAHIQRIDEPQDQAEGA